MSSALASRPEAQHAFVSPVARIVAQRVLLPLVATDWLRGTTLARMSGSATCKLSGVTLRPMLPC